MKTNKEKFLELVSNESTDTLDLIKDRNRKRKQIRESQMIAFKVLDRLDDLGWSQKELAKKMEVSPQQVNKIVRGQENMTLATQVKLQEILNIPILASYYENATVQSATMMHQVIPAQSEKSAAKIINMSYGQSVECVAEKMYIEAAAETMLLKEPAHKYESYTHSA